MSQAAWARRVVGGRRVIVPAVLAAVVALAPWAQRAQTDLPATTRVPGSESAAVERMLAERFESPFARTSVLVLAGAPSPTTPEGRALLREAVDAVRLVPGVTGTWSYLDGGDPLFAPDGGKGTFAVVGLAPDGGDALVQRLATAGASLEARLKARAPQLVLRWTGEPQLNVDLRRASSADVQEAEARALPLTALLLLLAFGTVVASAVAVASGALAVSLTLACAVLLLPWLELTVTLQSVASMLGLGLGIDYALLTLARFREARAAGASVETAAVEACEHAGHTVAVSGAAVAIGFAGLLPLDVADVRSVGVGGLLVVIVSVLLAVAVVPGVLALLGRHLERGRVPLRLPLGSVDWFAAWSTHVRRRPLQVLLVCGLPLLLLAWPARRMSTSLPDGDWLPAHLPSVAAISDLRQMGRGGLAQQVQLVLELPEEALALSREGWDAQRRLEQALGRDPRVSRLLSLRSAAGEHADDLAYVSFIPWSVKRAFVGDDGRAVFVGVVPRDDAGSGELARLARELRHLDVPAVTGVPGARLYVGGLPALNADYEDAVAGRFPAIVAGVVAGTFLALALAFRSLLVPLKAVALNLVTVVATFGAVVLVFQDGWGAAWLGLPAGGLGSVFPAVPALVFAIVFGLSMDYEVFLVARVAEAHRAGRNEADALREGLAHTGPVITSAAAVMVVVFGCFAFADLVLVQVLGFALAVAVLLDATVVRLALGPALLSLAGRWNWWPGTPAVAEPRAEVLRPVA